MNIYNLRKNYFAIFSNKEICINSKLAFKTKETHWLHTDAPVILPISIHSAFHKKITGEMKMEAFISIIKDHVKGKITILLTEKAHLNILSLKFNNNYQKAYEICLKEAQMLEKHFHWLFAGCNIAFWDFFICQDPKYREFQERIKNLYLIDPVFRNHLLADAETTYISDRINEYPDRTLFIEKTIDDIMEQCVCLLVLIEKGYRFQFYPGNQYVAVEYVNHIFFDDEKRMSLIKVFLTIEKKKIIPPTSEVI